MMFLGLDFGTSGARACVIDNGKAIVWELRVAYPDIAAQTPLDWRIALHALLSELPKDIAAQLQGLAIDGTSGTVLLCDDELEPVSSTLLYHDNRAQQQAEQLKTIAPDSHTVCTATSGLAKFLWLTQQVDFNHAAHFLHQTDWLTALLSGKPGVSDYHNALKTGYDVEHLCWPDWVMALPHAHLLPQVFAPGKVIGHIQPDLAEHFGIHPQCAIHAGTTDSIAAFIAADGMTRRCTESRQSTTQQAGCGVVTEASGAGMPSPRLHPQSAGCAITSDLASVVSSPSRMASSFISNVSEANINEIGIGVTSLGTTLVLKQLSAQRIEAPEYGVYSHRYGDLWLVGGASNAGAGVLRQYFDDAQLAELSAQIDPLQDSPLDYYPLTGIGERFPVNDAQLAPRLEPRPGNDAEFLHGILQGLAHIEAAGYAKLAGLGAPALKRVVTNGGGARNIIWREIRARFLGVPISTAIHCEAAYGSALLCRNDYSFSRSIDSN
jgi:sugar (pentulose or hexulose) kinase